MSNSKWTTEQKAAINTCDCNLLISAAAGAGKTAVLVERIIRKIINPHNPVDVDRLLVVTFTKAAAAEMRERISAAITAELNNNPASHHLNRQLTLLNRASITTLHSFCLQVLRQYFYRLELDPVFRVADDAEASLLRAEILDELFENKYAAGEEDFLALVDAYGGDRDDSALQTILLQLYNFASSHPWPELWLKSMAQNYCPENTSIDNLAWAKTIMDSLQMELECCRAKLTMACALAQKPGGPIAYLDNLQEDLMIVDDLIRAADVSWQELYDNLAGTDFSKLKACSKDADDLLKERVKKLREEVKKIITGLKIDYFSRPAEDLVADLNKIAPYAATLAQLVQEFSANYSNAKKSKAIVDFSDLEHLCLAVLMDDSSTPDKIVPSNVALELREYFEEVLIDEYQDTNGVQETILQLVSREGSSTPNRFMVGDVKQSIYRFRLAEPDLFMEKYQSYPREEGGPCLAIDLAKNFRSRPEVINAVNFIFRQLMTPKVGEMSYDTKAELVCGAQYDSDNAGSPVELYLLEKKISQDTNNLTDAGNGEDFISQDTAGEDEKEETDALQREARLIASRINNMVQSDPENAGSKLMVLDRKKGEYRPVQYRDIVILLRATKSTANTLVEELASHGIPAYADLGAGFFEAAEVQTIISLLKIIDNPRQDISLAAVLRSPLLGLNAGDLAAIRLKDSSGDFYDAVLRAIENAGTPADIKLKDFMSRVKSWRTYARSGPLSELIWRLYKETGYYAYCGGMPGGNGRQANLRALHDRAIQYEATSSRGLFKFLRFLEKFQESGNDLGTAGALGENEDVVRILSIHKSKGLEFPVVIVAGLGKQFNNKDLTNKALMHKKLGLGLPVMEREMPLTYPSLAKMAIKKKLWQETLAEEMRILYVALTRAREKLLLVGSVADLEKQAGRWCEYISLDSWPLPDNELAMAKNFLDWIGPAVARHRDGAPLRKLALSDGDLWAEVAGDNSIWEVNILNPDTLKTDLSANSLPLKDKLEQVRDLCSVPIPDTYKDTLDNILNYRYPYPELTGKAAKASVTEVKKLFAAEEPLNSFTTKNQISARPGFLQRTTGLSAAEKGSAIHLIMEHLNFHGDLSSSGIMAQLQNLLDKEIITKEQSAAIDIAAILKFLDSPVGTRLLGASQIQRELPFTMSLPAGRIYPELGNSIDDPVILQGVIDCLFEDAKGLVLLDYKTDRIGPDTDSNTIISRYRGQLNLYALAIESILKKKVTEKYLYMFSLGEAIEII